MDVEAQQGASLARIAAAIGGPARSRMLCCLLDGHARTGTELAIVAGVTPSTASLHLKRLMAAKLVRLQAQGRHRYYCLGGPDVARALEGLVVVTGGLELNYEPRTPERLRLARSCYDHMAGSVAVRLHDRLRALRWLRGGEGGKGYEITPEGKKQLSHLGVDVDAAQAERRQFAYACLDWSERRPHLAGALGAALLMLALKRRWVDRDMDSRALSVTRLGTRELRSRFGVEI